MPFTESISKVTPWARAAWRRALRTGTQVLAAAAMGNATGIIGLDWRGTIGLAGGAAFASLMTSIGGLPEAPVGSKPVVQ